MLNHRLKVGEVAKRSGVSIRTLHYYDEIGLLKPSSATDSGHRLYAHEDIARLQHIKSLRQLGFSLADIRNIFDREKISLAQTLQRHLKRLDEQIAAQQRLYRRIEWIASKLAAMETVSVDDFLQTIKETTMIEKYYSQEQLDYLAKRKERVGEERIQQVQQEWHDLIDAVRAEKDKGTDPASEPMQKLAAKWQSLIDEFTGGNEGVAQSLNNMYKDNPKAAAQYGYDMDAELFAYVGKAIAALK